MNRKKLISTIIIMVIIGGVIAAVNHYYLQPKVLLTMPGVERVNLPAKTKTTFKPDLYAGTMEKILSEQGESGAGSQLTAMARRNPFLWPEESTAPAPDQGPAGPGKIRDNEIAETQGSKKDLLPLPDTVMDIIPPQEFTLTMVIVGEASNLALVNNHFVSEGSNINGYDVVNIEPQTVMLASKNHKKVLTLEPSGGPLQYRKASEKKKTVEKKSPAGTSLDFQTQLKQVLQLYSDPNLKLK